ncbi:hypothetical protein JIG36_33340 [Actinoplanes sp. LDG1-06]|uniref:Uncharacterized protein n=1 Tax=Paractinoplanes ovalisporus TaxID=2810368 RepID=A0ABS2AKR5_9ACTN|nr:hypothetical protein [Actinoplanes ovalisporus]MBM2620407.1 hypothetical protein [Actinoplanes ovalisporus]
MNRQENTSMASSLFGPGTKAERSAQDIKAAQDAARAADARRERAAAAAGRDRRSIGSKR